MTPAERERMPKAFADAQTDAEYAMGVISQRVARGETVVPTQEKKKRRTGKGGTASVNASRLRVSVDLGNSRNGSRVSLEGKESKASSARKSIAAGLGALNSTLGFGSSHSLSQAQQAPDQGMSSESFFGKGTTDEPVETLTQNSLPPNITIDTSTPDPDTMSIMSSDTNFFPHGMTSDPSLSEQLDGLVQEDAGQEKQTLVEKLNWRRLRDKAYKKMVPAEMHGLLSPDVVGSNWGLGGEAPAASQSSTSVCSFLFFCCLRKTCTDELGYDMICR